MVLIPRKTTSQATPRPVLISSYTIRLRQDSCFCASSFMVYWQRQFYRVHLCDQTKLANQSHGYSMSGPSAWVMCPFSPQKTYTRLCIPQAPPPGSPPTPPRESCWALNFLLIWEALRRARGLLVNLSCLRAQCPMCRGPSAIHEMRAQYQP